MSPNESENKQAENVPQPAEMAKADEAPAEAVPATVVSATREAEELAAAGAERELQRTRASGWWAGLIIAAIVLIFLLIFILQNLESVEIDFLTFGGSLPLGVAMLLAAIAGILMVAVPGIARMIQLRRHAKKR